MARVVFSGLLLCCGLTACGDWHADPDGFTEADRALISSMVLTAPHHDGSNDWVDVPAARAFGQALFFDKDLANGARVACSDCHSPKQWFSDARAANNVSRGVGITLRNSPSLVNVAFYETFGWDGRADTLWGQVAHAYESPRTMGGSPQRLIAALNPRYAQWYQDVFHAPLPTDGSTPDDVNRAYVNVLKAWAAYLTQLTSTDSPFDRFAAGEREALTLEQRRGLRLFLGKAGCIECHQGASFTDNKFHSIGVGQVGADVPVLDLGHFTGLQELAKLAWRPLDAGTVAPTPTDVGQFRTKGLRQVAETGPYFHAGQVETLKDAVWFYTRGGDHQGSGTVSPFLVELGLTDDEQEDLVAFLRSLTGTEVPRALRCDSSLPSLDGGVREFEVCAP